MFLDGLLLFLGAAVGSLAVLALVFILYVIFSK